MSANKAFSSWLSCFELKSGQVNSYHYALITDNIATFSEQCGDFQIAEVNILEELEYEKEDRCHSLKLREMVMFLLRQARPDRTRINNCMDELQDFFKLVKLNTWSVVKDFRPNRQFHELSAAVKLWILYALILHTARVIRYPRPIGRDTLGNLYVIVGKRMLYVQYGRTIQEMEAIEEKSSPLERDIDTVPRWRLLALTEESWGTFAILLRSFNEVKIAERVAEESRSIFTRSTPSPSIDPDQPERDRDNSLAEDFPRDHRRVTFAELSSEAPSFATTELQIEPSRENIAGARREVDDTDSHDIFPREDDAFLSSGQAQKTIRCMFYPHCAKADACPFIHPNRICNNFGTNKCPGVYCRFQHPICEEDGRCPDIECPYEHEKDKPSLLRMHIAKMKKANPLPNRGPPRADSWGEMRHSAIGEGEGVRYSQSRSGWMAKPADVEHEKARLIQTKLLQQSAAAARSRAAEMGGRNGELSERRRNSSFSSEFSLRADSIRSSGIGSSVAGSVCSGFSDESRSSLLRRQEMIPRRRNELERSLYPAVHNERPFSNKDLRCHYFPRCKNAADACAYAHPREVCRGFPDTCVRGRDCPRLHGPCTKDGACTDEHCVFEHYQQIPPRAVRTWQQSKHKYN